MLLGHVAFSYKLIYYFSPHQYPHKINQNFLIPMEIRWIDAVRRRTATGCAPADVIEGY
jgi:hypothetical protein